MNWSNILDVAWKVGIVILPFVSSWFGHKAEKSSRWAVIVEKAKAAYWATEHWASVKKAKGESASPSLKSAHFFVELGAALAAKKMPRLTASEVKAIETLVSMWSQGAKVVNTLKQIGGPV